MKRFVFIKLCLLLLLLLTNLSFSQVNTEAIRESDTKQGFQTRWDFLFGLQDGNSNFITGEAKIRLDYIKVDFRTFLAGNIEYKEGNSEIINNKGFLHYRFIYKLFDDLRPEFFAQQEYNEFVQINSRTLGGAGVRMELVETFFKKDTSSGIHIFLGVGAMYEMEQINQTPFFVNEIPRSTNYLTINWQPTENFQINTVTYFQFDMRKIRDHRILNESTLQFSISDNISLVSSLNYRYDREPPPGIKMYDIDIKNGITFMF